MWKGWAVTVGIAALGLSVLAAGEAQAKVEGDTVYLGAAVSLTGKYTTAGEHTRRGYDLAVKTINDAGGISVDGKTYRLEVIYYDDESTPARGAQLAERLINQDDVDFMLGPYSSGLTKAIAPVTEQYGVPMVEANGASLQLFNKGYRYLFAVLSTTEQYLASAVALAAELAEREGRDPATLKLAAAFENDPFSQDIRAGVLADAASFGIQVVVDDQLPPELNDMAATLAKAKAVKPDILVVSGHSKGAALAIRQVEEMRVDVPMLAITHCDSADVIGKFGAASEYTLCASQWAPTLSYRDQTLRLGGRFRRDLRGGIRLRAALPGGGIRSRSAGLRRCFRARRRLRQGRCARCAGGDGDADLLRQHQVRRDGQEHREAHGALPDPGRRLRRGRADQVGGLGGPPSDPAMVREVSVARAHCPRAET